MRRYSPRTCTIYREVLARFEAFAQAEPNTVNVRNYEIQLLDTEGIAPKTVNLHLSILSSYCKFLVKKGFMASNPVRLVPKPKTEKRLPVFYREDALDNYFKATSPWASQDMLEVLLATPKGPSANELYDRRLHRLIIALLADTGIRRSEIISLKCSSVDFSRKAMSVRGKGDKMRIIPLVPSLSEEISLYLKAADYILGTGRTAETPLLRTSKGRSLYRVYVDRAVKQELGSAEGITGRKSPHVLRHSLASGLLENGADLNSIKELLGHSSLAATQVYTHATVERLKNVYDNAHPRANKNGGNNGD